MNFNNPDVYVGSGVNYDPDAGLNYKAVVKLDIHFFADHIHKTYNESSSTILGTWNWMMTDVLGWGAETTLVDVVNDALSWIGGAISTAISAIKNFAQAVWNGIKAGLSYLTNAVLNVVVDQIASAFLLFIQSLIVILDSVSLNYDAIVTSNGINFYDVITDKTISIKIVRSEL